MIVVLAVVAAMLNPQVTQASISTTICTSGYSTRYRKHHPIPVHTRPGMIVDHNVSIELGGASTLPNMRYQTIPNSDAKNILENRLHKQVCAGTIKLAAAQAAVIAFKDK